MTNENGIRPITKAEGCGAISALTVEDRDIWSRFKDRDGFYGGTMRRMSRALDQSDASAMLHYTTNGELGSLPSSIKTPLEK